VVIGHDADVIVADDFVFGVHGAPREGCSHASNTGKKEA
jgi:hypothetical protein